MSDGRKSVVLGEWAVCIAQGWKSCWFAFSLYVYVIHVSVYQRNASHSFRLQNWGSNAPLHQMKIA